MYKYKTIYEDIKICETVEGGCGKLGYLDDERELTSGLTCDLVGDEALYTCLCLGWLPDGGTGLLGLLKFCPGVVPVGTCPNCI